MYVLVLLRSGIFWCIGRSCEAWCTKWSCFYWQRGRSWLPRCTGRSGPYPGTMLDHFRPGTHWEAACGLVHWEVILVSGGFLQTAPTRANAGVVLL